MAWSGLKVAGPDPFPREYHTATLNEGLIFIFGGNDLKSDKLTNDLTVLNTGTL
jgi:hypothetical protein